MVPACRKRLRHETVPELLLRLPSDVVDAEFLLLFYIGTCLVRCTDRVRSNAGLEARAAADWVWDSKLADRTDCQLRRAFGPEHQASWRELAARVYDPCDLLGGDWPGDRSAKARAVLALLRQESLYGATAALVRVDGEDLHAAVRAFGMARAVDVDMVVPRAVRLLQRWGVDALHFDSAHTQCARVTQSLAELWVCCMDPVGPEAFATDVYDAHWGSLCGLCQYEVSVLGDVHDACVRREGAGVWPAHAMCVLAAMGLTGLVEWVHNEAALFAAIAVRARGSAAALTVGSWVEMYDTATMGCLAAGCDAIGARLELKGAPLSSKIPTLLRQGALAMCASSI